MAETGGNADLAVIPDDVKALGTYAFDLADVLRSALQSVDGEVRAVTDQGWTGPASNSFADGWHACQLGGSTIVDALQGMAEKLGVTAAAYRAQDNQFAGELSVLDLPPPG